MAIDQNTMRALLDRGVDLVPAAGDPDWDRLQQKRCLVIGSDFKAVYTSFNGFLVPDAGSWLALWTLQDITDNQAYFGDCIDGMVPIGDFLIHSDIIVARISDERASVRLLYEGRELAPSIQELVARIAAGAFDVIGEAG